MIDLIYNLIGIFFLYESYTGLRKEGEIFF